MKVQKNQMIKFKHISDFTGEMMELSGTIKGFGDAIRKKWPIECGECPDHMMLIRREDTFGNTFFHAVSPEEVIEEA